MRRSIFFLALLAAPSVGCEALFHFDDYSTVPVGDAQTPDALADVADLDGAVLPTGDAGNDGAIVVKPECVVNADCSTGATAPSSVDGSAASEAGGSDAGSVSICVKATQKCARLLTAECPRVRGNYTDDNAVILGAMLTAGGPGGDPALEHAAWLAVDELNSAAAGGLPALTAQGPVRPIVVVSCDPGTSLLGAAKHLVDDLHVPAIVGPRADEDVATITQQVSTKGNTLLVSPAAPASSISNLVDSDLTWRDVPSDDQRQKLVNDQINALETALLPARGPTVKLGILFSTQAAGISVRDALSGTLLINSHFISDPANASFVTLDSYANADDAATLSAIATKYQLRTPDIIYVTAPEQVAGVIVPLEQALTLARATVKPYYVCTDAVKTDDFLAQLGTTNVGTDIKRRIRGVGVKPDTGSASTFGAFASSYAAQYGTNPDGAATAATYDAIYAITYAIAATPELPVSGASVAHGLRSLGVGDAFSVGTNQARNAMQSLAAHKSIALRGTYSLMQWDQSGDILGGTVEEWCVGSAGGPLAFASSGRTMDVETQVVGGQYYQCQ